MIVDGNEPTRKEPVVREQLNEALRTATENDDRCAMAIVRLIHAALKERDQTSRADGQPEGLSDAELVELLQAMVAQRSGSIRRYEESGQLELAERETEEIEVIRRFLPPQLGEDACAEAVSRVIADLGARKLKDTGRVISELKHRYPGQMDFAKARRLVCQRLG
ncbi:MAG TPA: GatB/YqeY domain-containing protein [Geminicoccaceae bacterium]|nr:GatB/YqeY domain-containing protein [Geminicoccaceae bacterium]